MKALNLSLRVRSTVTAMKESPITPTISIQGSLVGWCGYYLRQMAKVEAFPVKRIFSDKWTDFELKIIQAAVQITSIFICQRTGQCFETNQLLFLF